MSDIKKEALDAIYKGDSQWFTDNFRSVPWDSFFCDFEVVEWSALILSIHFQKKPAYWFALYRVHRHIATGSAMRGNALHVLHLVLEGMQNTMRKHTDADHGLHLFIIKDAAACAGGNTSGIYPEIFSLFVQFGFCTYDEPELYLCTQYVLDPDYLQYLAILFDPTKDTGIACSALLSDDDVYDLARSILCNTEVLPALLASGLGKRITSALRCKWTGNTLLHEAAMKGDSFDHALIPLLQHGLNPFYLNNYGESGGDAIRNAYNELMNGRGRPMASALPEPQEENPVLMALHEAENRAYAELSEEKARLLLALGAHPRVTPHNPRNAIHSHQLTEELRQMIINEAVIQDAPKVYGLDERMRPSWVRPP